MRPVDQAKPINARRRTASTEVHWIPRTDSGRTTAGLHEWAVVDRALGGRDWAEIDPMRVRKSKGVRHRFTPAMYYWQRTRSHVWCESQLERWEVLWLDYSGQVERLWSQPLALTFGHGTRLSGDLTCGWPTSPNTTGEGTHYLCAIKDMFPARIVGYSISESHPAATTPQWESFFSLLQKNDLNRRTWTTRDERRIAIMTWIGAWKPNDDRTSRPKFSLESVWRARPGGADPPLGGRR